MRFGTNHFGHFLLTNLLLDLLKKSAPSRVVTVSSMLHSMITDRNSFNLTRCDPKGKSTVLYPYLRNYSASKLANILFSAELARRLESTGVVSVSLHPGAIFTSLMRKSTAVFGSYHFIIHYAMVPFYW